jgi:hypothetical protein
MFLRSSYGAQARIGLDFDNTLVDYDRLFFVLARERGLVSEALPPTKLAVRDTVRRLPDGELLWQRLQAAAYGGRICEASLFPGAQAFMTLARRCGMNIFIVSHKTRVAKEGRADMHQAALAFMRSKGFFDPAGPSLHADRIFFEATRRAKVARIGGLGLGVFVDDLPEVFVEPGFPEATVRVLFAPAGAEAAPDFAVVGSYAELSRMVFGRDLETE